MSPPPSSEPASQPAMSDAASAAISAAASAASAAAEAASAASAALSGPPMSSADGKKGTRGPNWSKEQVLYLSNLYKVKILKSHLSSIRIQLSCQISLIVTQSTYFQLHYRILEDAFRVGKTHADRDAVLKEIADKVSAMGPPHPVWGVEQVKTKIR